MSFSVGPETPSLNITVLGTSTSTCSFPYNENLADWVEKHNFGKDIEIGEADVDVSAPPAPFCLILQNPLYLVLSRSHYPQLLRPGQKTPRSQIPLEQS